ncbi:MAG: elongation factor Ts [Limisphaerales bacterium]|jgi:elongation factor Ts
MSATITAAEVNKLRKITGAGLMDCKKALVETGGDVEEAIDFLRKKGQKVAEKRADREATEGVVIARTSEDGRFGVIVRLSSETDFVSKNEEFIGFANSIAELALSERPSSKDDLLGLPLGGATVGEKITEMVGKIGEKIEVAEYATLTGGAVIPYIHAGYKIGVLTVFNKPGEEVTAIGRDISMQIAAMSPISVDETSVAEEVKERELAIGREQAIAEGKAENFLDRIAEGKLKKFYKERTLVHQQFVKDSSKTVAQAITEVDKDLKVDAFVRVSVGE